MNRSRYALAVLLLAIFAFYAFTLRDGHIWSDDFAMYIMHARNIAEGHPYAKTDYIFNPDYPILGPVSYPPGYPLLLAPIWALRGLDLTAMKLLDVTTFTLSLALLFALYRKRLPAAERLILVAIAGFTPLVWEYKDFVGSDFMFLAVLFLTLLVIDQAYAKTSPPSLFRAVPIGLLLGAVYSVRTIGAVLIPALLIYDFLRTHRLSRFTAACCLIGTVACLTQSTFVHSVGATTSLLRLDSRVVLTGIKAYWGHFHYFWLTGRIPLLPWLFTIGALITAAWQFLNRLRPGGGIHITEVFLVCYMGVLLVYVYNDPRFLLPVFPLCLALSLELIGPALRQLPLPAARTAAAALFAAWTIGIVSQYSLVKWTPYEEGIRDEAFLAVTDFIENQTLPTDVVLFRKPRLLALLTGRRAATYALTPGLGPFISHLPLNYVVADNAPDPVFESDAQYLWPWIEDHSHNLDLAFRNAQFSVYRVTAH